MLLGCIADDFTGATDLANTLVRGGLRTALMIGVPRQPNVDRDDVDAIVIALKSRTIEPADAVQQSLAALSWLRKAGSDQFFFKYCSTFDSTERGNIGPVIDALMDALDTRFTIACPAYPDNARTVFRGHLFVGDALLSESGMRDHPLTPMRDANLVRVLQRQTRRKVGLVRYDRVHEGAAVIRRTNNELAASGVEIAIVDSMSDSDLRAVGAACNEMPLVTGGSGVAIGLAANLRGAGQRITDRDAIVLPRLEGRSAVLSGSCSQATHQQVEHWRASRPSFAIDPLRLAAGEDVAAAALEWQKHTTEPVLVFATASPALVAEVQASIGAERAGELVEACLATIARGLVEHGVTKLVIAGGETSSAIVKALGVESLRIGPQIDPGVAWTLTAGEQPIALALKSGNFGSVDVFEKALRVYEESA